jgi:hypothetical protein
MAIIQDSDRDIFVYCQQLRFCTISHLIALTGRTQQTLNARLQTLIKEKYIYRIKFSPNQKHIFTLDINGFFFLTQSGLISIDDVPNRFRMNELKPMFLEHTLFVSDIHATLMLASRTSYLQLSYWNEGKAIADDVTISEGGHNVKYPVCPDGFFIIKNTNRPEPNNRLAYALEADRSTTTRRTFNEKLKAYCAYLTQQKQLEKFDVSWFRMVTVTLTTARAESLANLARETVPEKMQKYFLFASREHFSLDNPTPIYEPVFMTPKDKELVRLVP